jgi:tetratricopeptide (TPR) repeat protein
LYKVYYKRGVAYYYNEQDANAVLDYNKAISLGANSPDIYFMRAKSEAFLGNNNAALSDYARVIELDSNYVEAYVQRAYVFLTLKQMMPAFVFFTKAINKNPNQPADVYFARGYTYQETGAFQQALGDYAKAIELDAEFSEPYLNSGNCHYALKDYNKALEYYSLAEKLNPANSTVYFARGFVFLDTGDTDKACQEWQKALGMGNTYAQPYIDQHCGKK